jgi:hypothetical protein
MFDASRHLYSNFCSIQETNIVTFVACLMSEVEENSNANQDMGFPRVQNREVQAIYFLSDRFPEENKQILPFINVITAALK